jgi:hypothetical protein
MTEVASAHRKPWNFPLLTRSHRNFTFFTKLNTRKKTAPFVQWTTILTAMTILQFFLRSGIVLLHICSFKSIFEISAGKAFDSENEDDTFVRLTPDCRQTSRNQSNTRRYCYAGLKLERSFNIEFLIETFTTNEGRNVFHLFEWFISRRAKPIELLIPTQTKPSSARPNSLLSSCLHLKYIEINDFLFSQEEPIHTCLQQHLERFNSVLNPLQMSPRNHLSIPPRFSLPLSNLENVSAIQHFPLSSDIAGIESLATFTSSF